MKKLVVGLMLSGSAFAVEVLEPSKIASSFESGMSLGFLDYNRLESQAFVGFNVDYRVKYPFLVGGGLKLGFGNDLLLVNPQGRFKVRLAVVDRIKVDPYFSFGLAYVRNEKTDRSKTLGQVGVGISILYFLSGVHVGLQSGYNFLSDNRFNYFYIGGVVGF